MISLWGKKKVKKKHISKKIPCCERVLHTYFCCMYIATKDEHTRPCGNELTRLWFSKTTLAVKGLKRE